MARSGFIGLLIPILIIIAIFTGVSTAQYEHNDYWDIIDNDTYTLFYDNYNVNIGENLTTDSKLNVNGSVTIHNGSITMEENEYMYFGKDITNRAYWRYHTPANNFDFISSGNVGFTAGENITFWAGGLNYFWGLPLTDTHINNTYYTNGDDGFISFSGATDTHTYSDNVKIEKTLNVVDTSDFDDSINVDSSLNMSGALRIVTPAPRNDFGVLFLDSEMTGGNVAGLRFEIDQIDQSTFTSVVSGVLNDYSGVGGNYYGMNFEIDEYIPFMKAGSKNYYGFRMEYGDTNLIDAGATKNMWGLFTKFGIIGSWNGHRNFTSTGVDIDFPFCTAFAFNENDYSDYTNTGIKIQSPSMSVTEISGSWLGSQDNLGILIENMDVANSDGIAIKTEGGRHEFGDDVNITGTCYINDLLHLEPVNSFTGSPAAGMIQFLSTNNTLCVYTGSAWEGLH